MSNQNEIIINNSDDENNSSNIKVVEKPKRKYVKKAPADGVTVSKKTKPVVTVATVELVVADAEETADDVSELSDACSDHSIGCVNCGDEDDEDEIAKAIAMLQAKQAEVKKRKQMKSSVTEYRNILIANRQEKMRVLKAELDELASECQTLAELPDDELLQTIDGDNKLKAELKIVAEKPAKVASKKSVSKKVIVKPAGSRNEKMPPKARWEILPEGSVFKCFQKDKAMFFKKNADGDLDFCDETGKLTKTPADCNGDDWDTENPIQSAANYFKKYAKVNYNISGWEFCQLYNVETKKHKSLKRWDGDAEYIKF
jgi:hypothetical protein